MKRSKNIGFADRLSAAADANKAQLERAARAVQRRAGAIKATPTGGLFYLRFITYD
jgi:hypothetical protein